MDATEVIALLGGSAALVGAGVAIWQAIDARRARNEARQASSEAAALAAESNAAWNSIAESQKVVAQAHRPKAWSTTKHHSGDLWTIRNTSERPIVVESLVATPENTQTLLEPEGIIPRSFKAGELLEFYARSRFTLSIRKVTLVWRFEGEDGHAHNSERTLGVVAPPAPQR